MKLTVAKSSGFCFGVQRAVAKCEDAAKTFDNCVTLGPIIHNDHVIHYLEKLNIRAIMSVPEASPSNTVIIRSHGAGKDEYRMLEALGTNIVDATCPYVQRIHDIVQDEARRGRLPVIIGNRNHPEVTAISGWCDRCEVFETVDELSEWLGAAENAQTPQSYVFQTTSGENLYHASVEIIKKECTNYSIFDTICDATRKRQQEAVELSKNVDVMVIVGDGNSANSLRLVDICKAHCQRVFFVSGAKELDGLDIRISDAVGITAGASTPAWIIKEVTQKMSEEVIHDETCVDTQMQEPAAETEIQDPVDNEPVSDGEFPAIDNEQLTIDNEEAIPVAGEPGEISDERLTINGEESLPIAGEPGEISDERLTINDEESLSIAGEEGVAIELPESINDELSAIDGDDSAVDSDAPATAAEEQKNIAEETVIQDDTQTAASDEAEASETSVSNETFEEMLEKSIKTLHTGQKVTGIVTSITATEVSVDLGAKQSGYIPVSEFTDDTNTNVEDFVKVGDSIESFVMRVNDVEGMIMLSKKRLDAIKNWDAIEESRESKATVTGTVTEENKGGVVVNVKGVRVFVPASQTGLPKSAPMSELVKKTVKLRITEVNQSRRRVVGSIRAVQLEERREKSDRLWEEIEIGKEYTGVVKSMTSYGVFVDIGGVDGMIHISQLSWTRIKQPSEVMSLGDEVNVYILSFDKDNRKISLGYKKSDDDPWMKFASQYSVGDIVNVRIVKMMPFGAFAEICQGVDGLIHISQISDHRIGLPSEVLSNGQTVDVKITAIDSERKKISLSIRALIDPTSQPVTAQDVAKAADDDRTPVILYDTDAPPEAADGVSFSADDTQTEADAEDADSTADDPVAIDVGPVAIDDEQLTISDDEPDAVADESGDTP